MLNGGKGGILAAEDRQVELFVGTRRGEGHVVDRRYGISLVVRGRWLLGLAGAGFAVRRHGVVVLYVYTHVCIVYTTM